MITLVIFFSLLSTFLFLFALLCSVGTYFVIINIIESNKKYKEEKEFKNMTILIFWIFVGSLYFLLEVKVIVELIKLFN